MTDPITAPVAQAVSYARIAHCPEDGSPSEMFSEMTQAEGDGVFGPAPSNARVWDPASYWLKPQAPEKIVRRKGFTP
jgi:hypothetical protein